MDRKLIAHCDTSSSPCIMHCAEEYRMPAAREGFAEEATFKLAIEALVGVRGKEGRWSKERTLHVRGLEGGK